MLNNLMLDCVIAMCGEGNTFIQMQQQVNTPMYLHKLYCVSKSINISTYIHNIYLHMFVRFAKIRIAQESLRVNELCGYSASNY